MCCFCWTAFRRHKQKSGCVFVFPMIWQLFMPSCWAVASGCPVSYGCACWDRGEQKQLLFRVMLRNSHCCRFSFFVGVWPSCHNNRLCLSLETDSFFRFILWRVLPWLITLGLFSPDFRDAWKYPESCSETLWCQSDSIPSQSFLCHVLTLSPTSTNATWSAVTMNVSLHLRW